MSKHDDDKVVLPGFRFHPTDEELVGFYLKRKVEKKTLNIELIKVLDIYKYDPWDLPKMSGVVEKEWYFFCIRGRKYRNSTRPNRVITGSGFWKATGIDKPIIDNQCIIGLKKSLVYYKGSAGKGTKTDWMMHEFRLPTTNNNAKNITQDAEVWTLCRIFKRISPYKKYIPDSKEALIKPKSLDSDSGITEQNVCFGESTCIQHNQLKSNLLNHSSSQTPFSSNFSSSWNPNNGDDFFRNGNWDELRSVVEHAADSSPIYDYR